MHFHQFGKDSSFTVFHLSGVLLNVSKNKERRERRSPDNTPLAHLTILLPAVANAKTGSNDNPVERKKYVQSCRSTIKISNSIKKVANGMHCVWQKLMSDELLKESINIIMSSWGSNTSKKYNTYIKQWIEFCEKSNRDFQNATVKDGLDFFSKSS